MELANKAAVVTGAGRGLGKAIALRLASMGARVVLNDIPGSDAVDGALEEFLAKGHEAAVSKGDVRDEAYVRSLVKSTLERFGSLDVLVNNAGITRDKPLAMMSEQDWDDVIGINLKGAFLCTKAAAKAMIRQRSGAIVNIASVAGVMGNPGQANYSASKAGLIGLTKTTAKELAPRGITCNAVAPGFIVSKMTDALPQKAKDAFLSGIPLGRFGTAEDVAGAVAFLASGAAAYITGHVLHIDGGLAM